MVCVFADLGGMINQQCHYAVRSLRSSSGFSWRSARELQQVVRDFDPSVIHLHCDNRLLGAPARSGLVASAGCMM